MGLEKNKWVNKKSYLFSIYIWIKEQHLHSCNHVWAGLFTSLDHCLSSSLTHKYRLSFTLWDTAHLLSYWLAHSTLYGANDKYELYMRSLSYVG